MFFIVILSTDILESEEFNPPVDSFDNAASKQTTRYLEEFTREHDERAQQSGWIIPITASGRQL